MPSLPSGKNVAISKDSLFDHGGNWFECPEGHFWHWVAAPEMGSPPFDPNSQINQIAQHSLVPKNRDEAREFIRVLELNDTGEYIWRGEWLSSFPRYICLEPADLTAWNAWLAGEDVNRFLDATIAECRRLSKVSRNAQGFAVVDGSGELDGQGWVKGHLVAKRLRNPEAGTLDSDGKAHHDIEMHNSSKEYGECWSAACGHLGNCMQKLSIEWPHGPFYVWLKANLNPPILEHCSFRLGYQLYFIRIEDIDGRLFAPGNPSGLLYIAQSQGGRACRMPMRLQGSVWLPVAPGWGLVDASTGRPLDPSTLISNEPVEMTDWELQEFAVQIVSEQIEKEGRVILSSQGNPSVDPSVWFEGSEGPEWIVICAARYPQTEANRPLNLSEIVERCSRIGRKGHFASVSFANWEETFDLTSRTSPLPLWRGHRMAVKFDGLESI